MSSLGWMMTMMAMLKMMMMMVVGWRQLVGGTMSTPEWIDSAALHCLRQTHHNYNYYCSVDTTQ